MTRPAISFEFFPPQSLQASFRLWDTVNALKGYDPSFASVTYGAGGTTRKLTHDAVEAIHNNYGLNVAAHLTCVDASREETLEIIDTYKKIGVSEIVALRGDPPKGSAHFQPTEDGFQNSCELIEAIKTRGDFTVRVGAYPEKHPQSHSFEQDIDYFVEKVNAGADGAITQYF
ncbi:MAG: methylenetetrahydrofolate reductase, partial [Halocynthiibacter sp.]